MMNAKLWIVPVIAGLGLSTTISAQEPGSLEKTKPAKSIRLRTPGKVVKVPGKGSSDNEAVTIPPSPASATGPRPHRARLTAP